MLDLAGHTVIPRLVSLHEHTCFGGLGTAAPMTASAYLDLAGAVFLTFCPRHCLTG